MRKAYLNKVLSSQWLHIMLLKAFRVYSCHKVLTNREEDQ